MSRTSNHAGETIRAIIRATGVVQGVGFRPFVYQEAVRLGLTGTVINTGSGVEVDVEGATAAIEELLRSLREKAPPLSRVTEISVAAATVRGSIGFEISRSVDDRDARQLISPDSCTCDACLEELFDPSDRRFGYPFINCTSCGPRFTIIDGLPYDRPLTTMKSFSMCPECRAEYEDPGDRRFHAEPNACPECGPLLWLADEAGRTIPETDPLPAAAAALREGKIVAIKGLGGFQLACLATDGAAVSRLRLRKRRPHKPFATMVGSVEDAALHCRISATERELLESPERPVVLMDRLPDSDIAGSVAPRLGRLGLMLPCSPLHFVLISELEAPLVMTSGNLSEEPICRTNSEAASRLDGIADLFLFHDRKIVSAYDDSVAMVMAGEPALIRRARGYAPIPVRLPVAGAPLLAAGGELKNTFCLTRGADAFISQHIGDLRDADTLQHFERTEALYERLFRTSPERFVCDSHPDYLSTAYSRERDPAPIRIQHHRAHMAACLADNGYEGKAVGVALDGTGFGDDGAIWGGEFFTGSIGSGFVRAAHLEYMPLLGGEAAVREPWRMALAATWEYAPDQIWLMAERLQVPESKLDLLRRQLESGLNCPPTSSCGRLFDAVAAMTLGRLAISYEAQAAIEFEAVAAVGAGYTEFTAETSGYRFSLDEGVTPWTISPALVIDAIIGDITGGVPTQTISRRFHMGLAEVIVRTSQSLAGQRGLEAVALSGGVFQNRVLLELVHAGLLQEGLRPLIHRQVPANDGGLSLGQAAIAAYLCRLDDSQLPASPPRKREQ